MADLLFIALAVGFFAVTFALVKYLERLREEG